MNPVIKWKICVLTICIGLSRIATLYTKSEYLNFFFGRSWSCAQIDQRGQIMKKWWKQIFAITVMITWKTFLDKIQAKPSTPSSAYYVYRVTYLFIFCSFKCLLHVRWLGSSTFCTKRIGGRYVAKIFQFLIATPPIIEKEKVAFCM